MKNLLFCLLLTTLFGLFAYQAMAEGIVTDGLLSYWTFDRGSVTKSTVKDMWGEYNGTIYGNPNIGPGQIGDALVFDGVGDFVDLTTLGDFGGQLGQASFEAWFKTRNMLDWMTLMNSTGPLCHNWGIQFNPNKDWHPLDFVEGMLHVYISLRMKKENEVTCISSGRGGTNFDIFDGKWHHIVYTTDYVTGIGGNGRKAIYIDGIFYPRSKTFFGEDFGFFPFTKPVYLGATNDKGIAKGFFEGAIDEVRFYTRPLTAEEVIQNFESRTPYDVRSKDKLPTRWGALKRQH